MDNDLRGPFESERYRCGSVQYRAVRGTVTMTERVARRRDSSLPTRVCVPLVFNTRLAGVGFLVKGFLGFLNKTQCLFNSATFGFWVFHISLTLALLILGTHYSSTHCAIQYNTRFHYLRFVG